MHANSMFDKLKPIEVAGCHYDRENSLRKLIEKNIVIHSTSQPLTLLMNATLFLTKTLVNGN